MKILHSINWKNAAFTIVLAAITSLSVIWGYTKYNKNSNSYAGQNKGEQPSNYKQVGLFDDNGDGVPSFEKPSAAAIPTIVHIKTKTKSKAISNNKAQKQRTPFDDFFGGNDLFDDFFGNRQMIMPEQQASGSGVIISQDGYIITNNHVIEGSDEVTVTLNNKKKYTAKVIGADPSFDLAVLKIDATNLPYIIYGNSDNIKVGQWVLAIGYPLDLETTVTAGIISAKSRSIKLNRESGGKAGSGVESFIQTDAAVNKGNSGGGLINTSGELIGINSAIFSPTGYYSGYSYAIPVNLVKKVVDDMIKFGNVQRGYLGLQMQETSLITDEEKKALGLVFTGDGILVTDVLKSSGAAEAGVKKNDIIKKINNEVITLTSELQEAVAKGKPGDKVNLEIQRGDKIVNIDVVLKNKGNNTDVVKAPTKTDALGVELINFDESKAKKYNIKGGILVKKIKDDGAIFNFTRMKDGFVIVSVDGVEVKNINELNEAIGSKNTVTLGGFYPGQDDMATYEYQIPLD